MNRFFRHAVAALTCLVLAGSTGAGAVFASEPVSRTEMDSAIARHADRAAAQRARIHDLLQRDDVQAMAAARGVDLERANAAVDTLDREDLQRLSNQTSAIEAGLAGGDMNIQISLVALLLIIIIVILLAD